MKYTKEDYHVDQPVTAAPNYVRYYGKGVVVSAEEYLNSGTSGAADRIRHSPEYVLVKLQKTRTEQWYYLCVPPNNIAPLARLRIEGNELILEEVQ
jgi:hypothetical protein